MKGRGTSCCFLFTSQPNNSFCFETLCFILLTQVEKPTFVLYHSFVQIYIGGHLNELKCFKVALDKIKAIFLSSFCKSIFQSTGAKTIRIFSVLISNCWYKINYSKYHNYVIGTSWRSLQTHRKYSILFFPYNLTTR